MDLFRYISFILFIIASADLQARLGESEEELNRRYGKPAKQEGRVFVYTKSGFILNFFVEEYGYAKLVLISKQSGQLSDDEIKLFMEKNGMEELVDLGNPDSTSETRTHQMKLWSEGSMDQLNAEKALETKHHWGAKWEGIRPSDWNTALMAASADAVGGYKFQAIYDKASRVLLIWMDKGLALYQASLKNNNELKAKSQLDGF